MTVSDQLRAPASDAGGDAYARAGVDLDARSDYVEQVKKVAATDDDRVLSGIGGFGSLYRLKGYADPVLSASTDGVGTKLRLAIILDRYDTVGQDLVNHCINDIFTTGADPLFFLDYIGSSRFTEDRKLALIAGMKKAGDAVRCGVIGGETADMPDIYRDGDFDLVGFIFGCFERADIIDGSAIREGDVLLALPSSGLHTNGYSLVRRIFGIGVGGDIAADRAALNRRYDELGGTLGDALMAIHRPYYHELKPVAKQLHGIAHITGGGLIDNVPRVLPEGLAARFDRAAWRVPALFELIQREGAISDADMFHTFNMGLGIVVAVAPGEADAVAARVPEAMRVGTVERQAGDRRVIIE